jgi:hypothetical protein
MPFQPTIDLGGLLLAERTTIAMRVPLEMLLRIVDIKNLFHHLSPNIAYGHSILRRLLLADNTQKIVFVTSNRMF